MGAGPLAWGQTAGVAGAGGEGASRGVAVADCRHGGWCPEEIIDGASLAPDRIPDALGAVCYQEHMYWNVLREPWARAARTASRTPLGRNRFVDLVRAASIGVVVLGHWLMAAPSLDDRGFSLGDLLRTAPWSQWLTWLLQVMPLFFMVGGYSNAASWEAARRDGVNYRGWLAVRLRRLVVPAVPLLVFWAVVALVAPSLGVSRELLGLGSKLAFTPAWFLAVYVPLVVAAPASHAAWRRFGLASFASLAACVAVVDAAAFAGGLSALRWLNHGFVWLAISQIGYLWRDGRLAGPVRSLSFAALGLALLVGLVGGASYPVSMITVPGAELSNSRPPTLALLALGMLHGGLALTLEPPARRWLERPRRWTATVLVNASIMTLYLWHATVMVLAVGLAYASGGFGLRTTPATAAWWLSRPPWILLLLVALAACVALLGRFERLGREGARVERPAWRSVAGAIALCAGLGGLSRFGLGGDPRLAAGILVASFAGALLVVGPRLRPSNTDGPAADC